MSEWIRTSVDALIADGSGSIKTGPFGTTLKASEYSERGVPVISVGEVGYGQLRLRPDTPRVDEDVTSRLPEYVLRTGDIVFGRKGAVDRSAWVKSEQDGWFLGSDGIRLRLPPVVNSRFISYQMATEATRNWLLRHASGSTMLSLNQGTLGRVSLLLPSLPEQRAIAEVLGALDDKIAANTKLARTADDLAVASFHRASRDATYTGETFADVAKVSGGGTPSTKVPDYWGGDISWATPTDITALVGPYLESTSRTITGEGLGACSSELFAPGAILMTSRATIGAFAVAQVPIAVNQGFIVVEPHDETLRYWILHDMRSRVDEFIAIANGATFLELSRGNFKKFQIRVAEREVMHSFGDRAAVLHDSARQALRENQSLAETRDTLLPELMSGRLRVKDAEKKIEEVV